MKPGKATGSDGIPAPTLFSVFLTADLELVREYMPNGVDLR